MNLPSSHIEGRRSASLQSLTPARDLLCATPPRKAAATTTPTKSKRVRTGCLTCRERHLKCDEGTPDCLNCRKSNRECKRGVRLNFIDIQVKQPPRLLPPTVDWTVKFQDESRQIASEYVGGLKRYAYLPKIPVGPAPHTGHLDPTLRRQAHLRQLEHGGALDPRAQARNQFFPQPPTTTTSLYGYQLARSLPEPHISGEGGGGGLPPTQRTHTQHDNPFPTPRTAGHLPPTGMSPYALQDPYSAIREDHRSRSHHSHRNSDTSSAGSIAPRPSFRGATAHGHGHGAHLVPDGMMTPPPSEKATAAAGEREYLNSPEEIQYMQVFVQEVGVWMDSLDKEKHFSRLIPYHSLKSPMLLNAFLACGVKHIALTNPDWNDDKALYYYDTATTQLLHSLQNPDRNTSECATTAVVLNVYEIMSEKPGQRMRMNHIAGARALIRECGWDARSTGIGAACFWLNIGMEVLSCLASNWQTSWDPDHWGLDMEFAGGAVATNSSGGTKSTAATAAGEAENKKREATTTTTNTSANSATAATVGSSGAGLGREEEWVHRIFYIVAKIANFRATIPQFQEASPHDEQIRMGNRLAQWQELKRLCDRWNNACPRTMHPFGYLYPSQSTSKSAFPNVWLVKRAAIIGRLFYHTAQCVLAQTNPMEPTRASEEMRILQLHHAHQVCGIVAHTRDRGVASVAIRSLAVASTVLTAPREQEEVLEMMDRIHRESGWHLGSVTAELKRTWGWVSEGAGAGYVGGGGAGEQGYGQAQQQQQQQQQQQPPHATAAAIGSAGGMPPGPGLAGAMGGMGGLTSRFFDGTARPGQPPAGTGSGRGATMAMTTSTTSTSGYGQGPGPGPPGSSITAGLPGESSEAQAQANQQQKQQQITRVNPLSFADFSLPNHPYQNWYEPPNRTNSYASQGFL